MDRIRSRTSAAIGAYASVVTSPAHTHSPAVSSVSRATRLVGSPASSASRTVSLIWSAILSGCPSVTDSEVKSRPATCVLPVPCSCWCGASPRPCAATITAGRAPVSDGLPPGCHRVPDHVRQRGLRAAGYAGRVALGVEQDGLVLRAAEDLPPA